MLLPNSFLWTIILEAFSIVGLVFCAKVVVYHLVGLAKQYTISESLVGLCCLSIVISLPEIGTHLIASLGILLGELDYQLTSSIILGANIGSSITQQTLIIGLVVLWVGEIQFTQKFLQESYTAVMLTAIFTLVLALDGLFSRLDGGSLLLAFVGYTYFIYKRQQRGHLFPVPINIKKEVSLKHSVPTEIIIVLVALLGLLLFSAYVLLLTEQVVYYTGLEGSMVGVLSLGITMALPELFVVVYSFKNNATGLALGTLIGSNIVNPLLAIGVGAAISEFYVPLPFIHWDLAIQLITAALLLWWIMFNKQKLGAKGGLFLIGLYLIYLIVRMSVFTIN